MPISIPTAVPISAISTDLVVDDKRIEEFELHPGDEVFCLGFPLLATSPGGFPILRTGRIASYPITPMETVKEIFFDAFLYGGNSGGPVYYSFSNRTFRGQAHLGGPIQGVLGLVIQQANSSIAEFADKPLNFGVIVPAPFIREAIDKLMASR